MGDTADQLIPREVGRDRDWPTVACGAFHTAAVKKDGALWGWGLNGSGQLGTSDTRDRLLLKELSTASP